jgi:hypothetical protein
MLGVVDEDSLTACLVDSTIRPGVAFISITCFCRRPQVRGDLLDFIGGLLYLPLYSGIFPGNDEISAAILPRNS